MTELLDYATLVDDAMRSVVRDVLRRVQRNGLPAPHHFFITLRTDHPNTQISPMLRAKYPHEITIVLQHQFWDLFVADDHFKVSLSFNNIPEHLVVPFAALTGFADPGTKFGLQFHAAPEKAADAKTIESLINETDATQVAEETIVKESAEIITLDAFRKK